MRKGRWRFDGVFVISATCSGHPADLLRLTLIFSPLYVALIHACVHYTDYKILLIFEMSSAGENSEPDDDELELLDDTSDRGSSVAPQELPESR